MNKRKAEQIYNRKFNKICKAYFVDRKLTEDEFIEKWETLRKQYEKKA